MKKIQFLLLILMFVGFNSFGQQLSCKDFKNGTFVVPANEKVPVSYKIIRNGNHQTEIVVEDPKGILSEDFQKKQYVVIEWINECSYRAKYDTTKMKMSDFHKLVNDNGGILNEMIKIENGCFYFKSTLTINGETKTLDLKMCKE